MFNDDVKSPYGCYLCSNIKLDVVESEIIKDIKAGEGKNLELKEFLPSSDKIAHTVVAFANTAGGRLIIGVNDQREIVGLDSSADIFELQEKVVSIVYDSCYPNILPDFYTTNVEGKLLFVIEVFRGSLLPYYIKTEGRSNGVYIRIGNTNRKASKDNIAELERQRNNMTFDEEVCYDASFDSLDISPLVSKFKAIGKDLNTERLKSLRLVKEEQGKLYPTQALFILLGKRDNAKVKCARFKGVTTASFIDKKDYEGDLFSQIEHVELFLKNHLNLSAEIVGFKRVEEYEIPIEVLREAIVNAYVHRDYTNAGREIKVAVFDDIINIVSPGAFPNTITLKEILQGRSELRNPVIAKVFRELDLIEQWGTGIRRIYALCKEAGIAEPLYSEKGDVVDLELSRFKVGDIDSVREDTGSVRESVVDYVRDKTRSVRDDVESVRDKRNSVRDEAKSVRDGVRDSVRDKMIIVEDEESILSEKQKEVLRISLQAKNSRDILAEIGVTYHSKNIKFYIKNLVKQDLLALTVPDKPNSKNQKYVTTFLGKSIIGII